MLMLAFACSLVRVFARLLVSILTVIEVINHRPSVKISYYSPLTVNSLAYVTASNGKFAQKTENAQILSHTET